MINIHNLQRFFFKKIDYFLQFSSKRTQELKIKRFLFQSV